jgi:hypothetical protein
MMSPDDVRPGLQIGLFADPEGHVIGVMNGGCPRRVRRFGFN